MSKPQSAAPAVMHPDQLAGQLRDVILGYVQKMRVLWDQMPAAEQTAYIKSASDDAVNIIDQCLDCMLVEGGVTLDASCHDVRIKKESIMAAVSIDRSLDNAELLQKAAHHPVKLAFAPQREKVRDLGETPKANPDQPAMFDDDDEVMGRAKAEKPKRERRTRTGKTLELAE